jgi:hypothetical protein
VGPVNPEACPSTAPHFVRSRWPSLRSGHGLFIDDGPTTSPCGSGCERTLCPSRRSALDHLRTAEVSTPRAWLGRALLHLPCRKRSSAILVAREARPPQAGTGTVAYPPEPSQLIPVKSRVSPLPPVVPSNGWAPEADGKAQGRWRLAKIAPAQDSISPFAADPRSIPRAAPPPASAAARCPLG